MTPEALRAALRGLDATVGASPQATVRIDGVPVTLACGARHTAAASSPGATPLSVEATVDALGVLQLKTNDDGFATALLDAGCRGRLERLLAGGGRAQLGLGRWSLEVGAAIGPRDLVLATAYLAARPLAIGRRWAALAARLGGQWDGTWSPHGGARFTLDGGVIVDVMALEPGVTGVPTRLRTVVRRDDDEGARWDGHRSAIKLGAAGGERLAGLAFLWGLVDDAEVLAELARMVGAGATAKPAAAAAALAPIAPMPIADWPQSRADFGRIGAAPAVWTLAPMPGSDAVPGLDETADIDGVAVTTRVVTRTGPELHWETVVSARADAAAPAVAARPGYHFLLAGLRRDDHLGDRAVDDRYIIHADDPAWARWWFGPIERQALLATFEAEALAPFAVRLGAEITFTAGNLPSRRYLDAARQATAYYATRGVRAAGAWRPLAAALGARIRGETFDTDGRFALIAERGAAQITIDAPTTTELDDGYPRLRTRVSAPRIAPHRSTLVMWSPELPRRHRPRAPGAAIELNGLDGRTDDEPWARPRLAACATPLARAKPDVLAITAAAATLWWEGPLEDTARLAAALDVIGYLAVEAGGAADGPYR